MHFRVPGCWHRYTCVPPPQYHSTPVPNDIFCDIELNTFYELFQMVYVDMGLGVGGSLVQWRGHTGADPGLQGFPSPLNPLVAYMLVHHSATLTACGGN